MKNLILSVEHLCVTKSAAASLVIFILAFSLSAFKDKTDNEEASKRASVKKTTVPFRFQSFADGTVDPSRLYVTKLNSNAVTFVRNYIRSDGSRLGKMKNWGKKYFELYDDILVNYGLPKELKYLSVVESDLIAKAVSVCGATGPWQIMADEGKRMGLRIDSRVDERKNFKKSTHAAAKILKELHSQFNDWTLVIAAYNCGAGRVRQAIRKSGSKNFWSLQAYLPAETRGHVKRFIAAHYFFEGSGGLTTMTASEVKRYESKVAALQEKRLKAALDEYCKDYRVQQYQLL